MEHPYSNSFHSLTDHLAEKSGHDEKETKKYGDNMKNYSSQCSRQIILIPSETVTTQTVVRSE
jgi:hypothetical protein